MDGADPVVPMRPSGGSAPSRRHAWTVFEILFALMVVDYVDRQIVVSMLVCVDASERSTGNRLEAIAAS